MLCPLRWSWPPLVSGLVSHLGWDAVSASLLSPVLSPSLSPILAGMPCLCSGLVSKISCAICAAVWGLRWCNYWKKPCPSARNIDRAQTGMGAPTSKGLHLSAYMSQFRRLFFSMRRFQKLLEKMPFNIIPPQVLSKS